MAADSTILIFYCLCSFKSNVAKPDAAKSATTMEFGDKAFIEWINVPDVL